MQVTVVIPTHNPRIDYLQRVLDALRLQQLPLTEWELLIVDNASAHPVAPQVDLAWHPQGRVIREEHLGLTAARLAGFAAARGMVAVLVDDDNVLAPDYLTRACEHFAHHPRIGVLGGKSIPEFAAPPADWTKEFHALLALRDLGGSVLVSAGLRPSGAPHNEYPAFAPIGAGMAIRRAAWTVWLDKLDLATGLTDRRGTEMTSGGDSDIVLRAMQAGWEVGYFPTLALLHLIPESRLRPDYLARLNHGIQKSWVQVLARHDACPWAPVAGWTVPLRQAKAWFRHRVWSGPAEHIRWQGACGHFEGLASLTNT